MLYTSSQFFEWMLLPVINKRHQICSKGYFFVTNERDTKPLNWFVKCFAKFFLKKKTFKWIVMGDVQRRQHTANSYHLKVDYCV